MRGQHPDRRRGAVEVVAAVVRHRDRGDAGVDGALGVVDPHDALEHERPAPLLTQPRDVVPRRQRRLHPLAVRAEERRAVPGRAAPGSGWSGPGSCRSSRTRTTTSGGVMPSGANWSIALRSIFSGMDGLPQSRPYENDQSMVMIRPGRTGGAGALHPLEQHVAAADPVHLEERLRVGRRDLLDRLAGERAQTDRRSPCRRGTGDRDLAVGVHGLHTGRRDHDGQRNRAGPSRWWTAHACRTARRRAGRTPARRTPRCCRRRSRPARTRRSAPRTPTSAAASSRAAAPRRPSRRTAFLAIE